MSTYATRAALAVLIIGLWFLAAPTPSHACSCIMPGTPSEELDKSAAVFAGKVVSVKEHEPFLKIMQSSTDPTNVEFAVSEVWKGPMGRTSSFSTARLGASCGFTFVEGKEYIVYSRDGGTVSLCSRTKLIAKAQEDLDALGESNPPGDETSNPQDRASSSGGCGMAPAVSPDLAMLGLAAGLIWAGLRKRPR